MSGLMNLLGVFFLALAGIPITAAHLGVLAVDEARERLRMIWGPLILGTIIAFVLVLFGVLAPVVLGTEGFWGLFLKDLMIYSGMALASFLFVLSAWRAGILTATIVAIWQAVGPTTTATFVTAGPTTTTTRMRRSRLTDLLPREEEAIKQLLTFLGIAQANVLFIGSMLAHSPLENRPDLIMAIIGLSLTIVAWTLWKGGAEWWSNTIIFFTIVILIIDLVRVFIPRSAEQQLRAKVSSKIEKSWNATLDENGGEKAPPVGDPDIREDGTLRPGASRVLHPGKRQAFFFDGRKGVRFEAVDGREEAEARAYSPSDQPTFEIEGKMVGEARVEVNADHRYPALVGCGKIMGVVIEPVTPVKITAQRTETLDCSKKKSIGTAKKAAWSAPEDAG